MAKKKRIAHSTTATRSKDVKDVKEVKDVKLVAEPPVQSPPSSPVAASPDAASSDVEVASARDKLKSVLNVLFTKKEETSDSAAEANHTPAAPKVVVKKEKPSPAVLAARLARKRRRRHESVDSDFHHTYVMKLFDRSVDLAQFIEDTPLYPICRAWMMNQPRNTKLWPRRESPSPERAEEEEKPEEAAEGEAETVKPTHKMPPPTPLPTNPDLRQRMKIPAPIVRPRAKEINMDMEVKPTKESLLSDHLTHWTAVRKQWHATGHQNEERFAKSARILKNIYKRGQIQFQ